MKELIQFVIMIAVIAFFASMCSSKSTSSVDNNSSVTPTKLIKTTAEQSKEAWKKLQLTDNLNHEPNVHGDFEIEIDNASGDSEVVSFNPIDFANEANLIELTDINEYNKILVKLERVCRSEMLSPENINVVNDVHMHQFMAKCLEKKGLSKNEQSYKKLYRHFKAL